MPVIGALFRSQAFKRGQSELVIIVTPVIVNPTSGRRISDAGRQLRAAERLRAHPARPLPGQPARREAVQNSIGQRRLAGPSGFVFK